MSVSVIYRCTVCNEIKQTANHWFVARKAGAGLLFNRWQDAVALGVLQESETRHLCGRECARKMLERFLAAESQPEKENPTL